jgi:4-amino-4-deoxy-L-arabinose transferase-like glycosyltransferase
MTHLSSLLKATPKPVLAAFALLVALKVGVLAILGPLTQPDSWGYVRYADEILSGAFRHVDLANDPMPITLTRTIGYPAVIAAAKIIAGAGWAWAVVLFQFAVSLSATAMVYRLARAFRLGIWPSLGVATAQATAMQFVSDQAILSDGLFGSTLTLAACMLGLVALRREPRSLLVYLGAGLLIAVAFLIRDVITDMSIGLVPLAVAGAMVQRSRLRQWAAVALVFLPLIGAHVAYTEWNRVRIGAPVVTSIAQAALINALTEAAVYDSTIFSGSTPIDIIGRKLLPKMRVERLGFEQESSAFLHDEYGWDAVRMSHEATLAYLRAWRDHPWPMIRHVFYHISETQLHQAVRPIETVRDVLLWKFGSDQGFARERAVRDGNWWAIPGVIVNWIVMTISVVVFLAFLLITPIRFVREGWTAETGVSVGFWFFYLVVGGLYAAVHLEPRYLTPVVAGSIVVGAVNIVRTIDYFRLKGSSPGQPA